MVFCEDASVDTRRHKGVTETLNLVDSHSSDLADGFGYEVHPWV